MSDEQDEELPYHPLIKGLNNPDGNYGWCDEPAPPCTECGTHTPEGTDTYACGWLCDECFAVLFR
jgi:hypothetical protein